MRRIGGMRKGMRVGKNGGVKMECGESRREGDGRIGAMDKKSTCEWEMVFGICCFCIEPCGFVV